MFDENTIDALQKAGTVEAAQRAINNGAEAVALPNLFTIHDLERFAACRRHMRGSMVTSRVEDFAAYTAANASAGHAAAFVDHLNMAACAVLNLGTPDAPGHCDNTASLEMRKTGAYKALTSFAGNAVTQARMAEFIEDWADNLVCISADGETIPTPKAIGAVRKISIESIRKSESEQQQLSASHSAFESVQVTSKTTTPVWLHFVCEPYAGFAPRTFALRLSITTGGDKPALTLRMQAEEKHAEEMGLELVDKVKAAVSIDIPVLLGTYKRKD